ncbi:putative quinol monooxygenase [Mucilaginibacter sp. AW1-3]
MYPLISKWYIAPKHKDEVIAALKQLAGDVKKHEPGTLTYLVHTPDDQQPNMPGAAANEVIFFEIYHDEAAFQTHINGPYFKDFVAKYGSLFVNNAQHAPFSTLNVMKHEAGFIRPGVAL